MSSASHSLVATLAAALLSATVVVHAATTQQRLPAHARVQLPKNHVTCARDDPNFDECFRKTLQSLLKAFYAKGVPELGLPPLDPVSIPVIGIEYTQGNEIYSNVTLGNFTAYGAHALKINRVRSDFSSGDRFTMDVNVFLQRLQHGGHYDVDGTFLQLPIRGRGDYKIVITDVQGTVRFRGHHFLKNGSDHVRIEHIDFRPSLSTLWFNANDLFTGNRQLSDAAVLGINLFWPIFYQASIEGFSQAWGTMLTDIANHVFLSTPFDTLFPLTPHRSHSAF